jgi:hypothetical protein
MEIQTFEWKDSTFLGESIFQSDFVGIEPCRIDHVSSFDFVVVDPNALLVAKLRELCLEAVWRIANPEWRTPLLRPLAWAPQ